jgi:putative phosphoesterase
MRVLVLADIHANWAALEALREPHDLCLCLGDLVDYCVDPAPCVDWVRRNARHAVRGNHDHDAAQDVAPAGTDGFRYLAAVTRPLTRERLSAPDLRYLAELPVTRFVTVDETRWLLVHATPRDPLDEWAPADREFWSRCLDGVEADVVCVGHTHQPYVLEVGERLVINPGSVGLPRDGDPRAAYAIVDGRNVELKRAEYPVERTIDSIAASALPDRAKEELAAVLRTGGRPAAREGASG